MPGVSPVPPPALRFGGRGLATPLMKQTSDTIIADPYQSPFPPLSGEVMQREQQERQPAAAISFGGREVDGVNVQAYLALGLLLIVALVATLHFNPALPKDLVYPDRQSVVKVESGSELINLLKENGLWEINGKTAVPPLILSAFPENIDELEIDVKKKAFLNSLLPAALVALAEVDREKQTLHEILAKFPGGYQNLVFSNDFGSWGRVLSMEEIDFLLHLTRKYRTNRAQQLVNRVDVVPLSLLLAQAAIESSWGSSRFAREGNNLFGIWTWGDKGLIPYAREDGMTHKVAMYDSILDSVRAYLTMLNRLPHYLRFRQIRRQSRNPLKLAEGLLYYSERGDSYVWELQNFIESNGLHRYDDCYLAPFPPSTPQLKTVELAPATGPGSV